MIAHSLTASKDCQSQCMPRLDSCSRRCAIRSSLDLQSFVTRGASSASRLSDHQELMAQPSRSSRSLRNATSKQDLFPANSIRSLV